MRSHDVAELAPTIMGTIWLGMAVVFWYDHSAGWQSWSQMAIVCATIHHAIPLIRRPRS